MRRAEIWPGTRNEKIRSRGRSVCCIPKHFVFSTKLKEILQPRKEHLVSSTPRQRQQVGYSNDETTRVISRTIILEFIGGSWDGRNLSNDTLDAREMELAVSVYLATRNGTPGRDSVLPKDYATALLGLDSSETDVFRVTDSIEIDHEVLVRLEYVGGPPC